VMGSLRDLVRELGCGVLVVEHDMRFVMQLCQRIHVLVSGMTIASGPPDAVGRDPKVIAAYLGVRS
jgi:branched-chain amino acid transport system ATP-binding protein